jgi:hypothetical protein
MVDAPWVGERAPWLTDLQLPAYRQLASGRLAQDTEVPAACAFRSGRRLERGMGSALTLLRRRCGGPGGRLADGVGEGEKVVRTGLLRLGWHGKPEDFPAPRYSE